MDSQNVTAPEWMILNVDFALKLSKYTSLKQFICLKLILKNFSTILHSQFNGHTLPVTPFNTVEVVTRKQLGHFENSKLPCNEKHFSQPRS